MGYIAAVLLMNTDEKSVFLILNSLFENYHMRGYFLPEMPSLKMSFYVMMSLVKEHLPKVFNHFKKISLTPTMFASQWFMTLYTVGFKIELTL